MAALVEQNMKVEDLKQTDDYVETFHLSITKISEFIDDIQKNLDEIAIYKTSKNKIIICKILFLKFILSCI